MATYYIDPSASTNGDGSLNSPFNTWVGITLTANNTYLQRRGTRYKGAAVRPQNQTSSAATPLTIGAYYNTSTGADDTTKPKPIIDHAGGTNGVGAVFIDTCSYVVVQDIEGINSNGALGGGITVRRSQNVEINRCVGRDSEHGICIQQDQASATSTCVNIKVDSCEVFNNVSGGITLRWGAASTAVLKKITITNNKVYNNGLGKGTGSGGTSVPCGGIMCYTVYKADTSVNYRSYDLLLLDNEVFGNNGYGVNIEMFANETLTSRIANNNIYANGKSLDVDSHSLWVGNSFNIVIEDNKVHDNYAKYNFTSGSGVGIYIDYNGTSATGSDGCVVRRNLIYNQYKDATLVTNGSASAGILVYLSNNTLIYSNVIMNCRNGIVASTSTDVTTIYNNTVLNCVEQGIAVLSTATGVTCKNNFVFGNNIGLFVNTLNTSGFAGTYFLFGKNKTFNKANGTISVPTEASLDATDLANNTPNINSSGRPLSTFVGKYLGTKLGYMQSKDHTYFNNPPSMGAYEYISTRGVR